LSLKELSYLEQAKELLKRAEEELKKGSRKEAAEEGLGSRCFSNQGPRFGKREEVSISRRAVGVQGQDG